jgi:glucose/arabinose dehydrogenase
MKSIILFIFAFNLAYSNYNFKMNINLSNGNSQSYQVNDINSITFDLNETSTIRIQTSDNQITTYQINNNSDVKFTDSEIIINSSEGVSNHLLFDISEITFLSAAIPKIPFGELEVDEVLLTGLNNPWGLAFLNKDEIIFTEHSGSLHKFNIQTKERVQLTGLPQIAQAGQGGLLDVKLHPNFSQNKYIYLAYSVAQGNLSTTAIGRGILQGNQLVDFVEIFRGNPLFVSGAHFGSRIVFDKDNYLYFSIGDRGNPNSAQDSTNHSGCVMRIFDDGRVPQDNPFVGKKDAMPEIYTMGNRNIQGMFYLKEKDEVWANEHGPQGGDELNIIKKGANYAWPLATYGVNYGGSPITDKTSLPGFEDPITYWVPSIAPCGMDLVFYDPEKDELDIVIGALAGQHIHRLLIRNNQVIESVRSLQGQGRFRDIKLSPDGILYTVTQSPGRLIKLKSK